jgi:pimeloyl-ACP methyl ester carboxylesterase
VPGFGGFDALGRVEYYSGVTSLFQKWRRDNGLLPRPVVLHYFDNLPTSAVTTRARRLQRYLAKRRVRGEILDDDSVVLVGHSTGGLDIRQLILDLHDSIDKVRPVHVDGGEPVDPRAIRKCVKGVVFLSVPHWGTNIADWVHSHSLLRKAVIADLRAAVAGSQVHLLDRIEAGIASEAATFTGADLFLALRDALTEANDRLCGRDPTRIAGAQEAASELQLYLRQMCTDFRVIEDLTSQPYAGEKSPAHFGVLRRKQELERWKEPRIGVLSYATVGGRPFRFSVPSGSRAPTLEIFNPFLYPEIACGSALSAGTDISYRLVYRACAGGPIKPPELTGTIGRVLGPAPAEPLELWDNDGIVNTVSMLWPQQENVLVSGDHLDIVGHYRRRRLEAEPEAGCESPRVYQSYDTLKSIPEFTDKLFEDIWTEIFCFAAAPNAFSPSAASQARVVKVAAGS